MFSLHQETGINNICQVTTAIRGCNMGSYRQNQIDSLEKVQRRGVRFITRKEKTASQLWYEIGHRSPNTSTTITSIMYNFINNQIAIPLSDYIKHKARATRSQHRLKFTRLRTSSDSYKYSLFPRTIKDWDELPQDIIELPTLEQFKEAIRCE